MRTPLGDVLGYAEVLQRNVFGELSPRQHKAVSEIVDSADYLTNMVNELLDEAQLRSSTATLQEKMFSPFKPLGLALAFRSNPAREDLGVTFSLPDASPARLELFDVGGRRISSREVGTLGAGSHVVTLGDGRGLAPGVYLLRLSHGTRSLTARGAILR